MKIRVLIITTLGLALAWYLLTYAGWQSVWTAATTVGWGGFALLCLATLLVFLVMGPAWHVLLPASFGLRVWPFIWARLVREGASDALPFSQVGGFVLGARAAILHGVSPPLTVASMIVDVTTEMLAQIAYIVLGAMVLMAREPHTPNGRSFMMIFSTAVILAIAAGAAFVALQRYGHHWMARKIAPRLIPGSAALAPLIAETLDTIYESPLRFATSLLLHFCGWIASAGVTWGIFRLTGHPTDFWSVVMIESLVCAARSVAFAVPNALGVQEAAYALLTPLVGVGKEIGLAVSLLKRARDIAIGVPIVLIWQTLEGRRVLASRDPGAV
jgi:glycosyltransferase 2 family protein